MYETMVFRTLDARKLRTLIPEGWETNEISLIITELTAFTQFLSLGTNWGGPEGLWRSS